MKKLKVALLIIDADNDFVNSTGTLSVPGAENAMMKLSDWIINNSDRIDSIYASQDAHSIRHIGHVGFWKKGPKGMCEPSVGQIITSEMLLDEEYEPKFHNKSDTIKYLKNLEEKGKNLKIWPVHSIDGSWGQAFPYYMTNALNYWTELNQKDPCIIRKGKENSREMYSIFSYSYPLAGEDESALKESFDYFNQLSRYDKILIAGQAGDYCVAETLVDLLFYMSPQIMGKIILLKDAISFIDPYKNRDIYESAIENYEAKEMLLSETTDYLDFLRSLSDENSYIPIGWPEIQSLMDLDGFKENSYLINDEQGLTNFGNSAYFVKKSWLNI